MTKLIIFDLDGVLVDAKEIHYNALNQALKNIDKKYVINRDEHLSKYDGNPTKTKLKMWPSCFDPLCSHPLLRPSDIHGGGLSHKWGRIFAMWVWTFTTWARFFLYHGAGFANCLGCVVHMVRFSISGIQGDHSRPWLGCWLASSISVSLFQAMSVNFRVCWLMSVKLCYLFYTCSSTACPY